MTAAQLDQIESQTWYLTSYELFQLLIEHVLECCLTCEGLLHLISCKIFLRQSYVIIITALSEYILFFTVFSLTIIRKFLAI